LLFEFDCLLSFKSVFKFSALSSPHFTSENGIPLPPQTRRSRRRIPHLLPPILYPRRLTQPARRHSSHNRCLDLLPSLPWCLSRDDHPTSAHAQLVSSFTCTTPGPRLIMNGHIDVFPASDVKDWARDPWSGDLVDGRIHG
jgi:acetylornithine deacetylase/succinyl-diaminopimelate desuccinylase-like protein